MKDFDYIGVPAAGWDDADIAVRCLIMTVAGRVPIVHTGHGFIQWIAPELWYARLGEWEKEGWKLFR